MEAIAKHKFARGSAQKARLVVDQIRGLGVEKALEVLDYSNKGAAQLVKKVLNSAIVMLSTMKVQTLMNYSSKPLWLTMVQQ